MPSQPKRRVSPREPADALRIATACDELGEKVQQCIDIGPFSAVGEYIPAAPADTDGAERLGELRYNARTLRYDCYPPAGPITQNVAQT